MVSFIKFPVVLLSNRTFIHIIPTVIQCQHFLAEIGIFPDHAIHRSHDLPETVKGNFLKPIFRILGCACYIGIVFRVFPVARLYDILSAFVHASLPRLKNERTASGNPEIFCAVLSCRSVYRFLTHTCQFYQERKNPPLLFPGHCLCFNISKRIIFISIIPVTVQKPCGCPGHHIFLHFHIRQPLGIPGVYAIRNSIKYGCRIILPAKFILHCRIKLADADKKQCQYIQPVQDSSCCLLTFHHEQAHHFTTPFSSWRSNSI